MRLTLTAFVSGAAWWAISIASIPEPLLRRSPASLVVALLTALVIARLSRPFYRGSAGHLLWLTPVTVYFGALAYGYLLPLASEHVDVLERCVATMRALCEGVTFSIVGLLVFPAAFATHWLLRRMARWDAAPAPVTSEI